MSNSETNIMEKLIATRSPSSSRPSTPSPTPSNEEQVDDTVLEEVMKVELRNRLTGEVIDFSSKKNEAIATEVPQAMLNSLYVSNNSLESELCDNDNELVFETKDDNEDAITELDTESESIDENTDEDNEDEEDEEDEEDPLDEEVNSKRYVVFDNGSPLVIILNQNKPQNDIPGIIVFMFAIVCGLWLFNNTCKLCTLIDDKCLFRMP